MHLRNMKTRSLQSAFAFVLLAATVGCTKQEVITPGGIGPSLVVEQFLRAANQKDLEGMGRLFGTKDGPVQGRWPRNEVELRMSAIAAELRHEDFEVVSDQMVPGRDDQATRLVIKLTADTRNYNVPFTLVRYNGRSWLIEQIGIEAITRTRE